jgi:hypothetical protein
MPNWCNNSFSITGNIESIKDLWDTAQTANDGEFGLLSAIMPEPKDNEDWYSWRVDNWGTKWEISDEGLEYTDHGDGTASIDGWFDSAWAPPIEAYNTFLDDMDNCSLEASYYEPGMDFGGFYRNGDDIYFEDLQTLLEQPTEEWSEEFSAFEVEYDLLSEEWRFENEEVELD